MKYEEIKARLEAEGITPYKFIEKYRFTRPEWVGKVDCIFEKHNEESKQELENRTLVYYLVDHDVYLEIRGCRESDYNEDDNYDEDDNFKDDATDGWDYYSGFDHVEPAEVTYTRTEYHPVRKSYCVFNWRGGEKELTLEVKVEKQSPEWYLAYCDKLPGFVAYGNKTGNKTKQGFLDTLKQYIESKSEVVIASLAAQGWVDKETNNILCNFIDL